MIYDGENLFFHEKTLSAATLTSDVIKVGVGESYEPMKLVVLTPGADKSKSVSVELQTATDEAFTTPVTLATYAKAPVSGPMPRGNLGYLRIKVTSTSTIGKITAGLVYDDNISQ